MRISAIVLDACLELVGRYVIQELGGRRFVLRYPSLLTIGTAGQRTSGACPASATSKLKSKK
jgi:hypothetical protein